MKIMALINLVLGIISLAFAANNLIQGDVAFAVIQSVVGSFNLLVAWLITYR